MKKDNYKTDVVFRKYSDKSIIALFPHNVNDYYGNVESYQHIGQHSGADYGGILMCTKLASKEEYSDLKKELEDIGYNLRIIEKQNRNKFIESLTTLRNKTK